MTFLIGAAITAAPVNIRASQSLFGSKFFRNFLIVRRYPSTVPDLILFKPIACPVARKAV
jgi:hypothetical protein